MKPTAFFAGLLLLTTAGYALRFHHLANWGVWQDEIALWMEVLGTDATTADPILPRTLIYLWMRLTADSSLFALHVVPILFGGAAVTTFGIFLRELVRPAWGDEKAAALGWIGAALFTVWPAAIYYSVEARPYAFLLLATPLLYLSFLRAERDPRLPNLALYGASVALASNCHYVSVHILVGFFIVVAWETLRDRNYKKTGLLVAATLLGGVPALITIRLKYVLPILEMQPKLSVAHYLGVFFTYEGPAFFGVSFTRTIGPLTYFAVLVYGGARLWRLGLRRELTVLVAVCGASLALTYGFLGVKGMWGPITVTRYLVHLLIPLCALTAVAILEALENWRRAVPYVLTAVLLLVVPIQLNSSGEDFQNAADLVRAGPTVAGVIGLGDRPLHAFAYFYGSSLPFHGLFFPPGRKASLREARPVAGRGDLRTMWDLTREATTLGAGTYALVADAHNLGSCKRACQFLGGRLENSGSRNLAFCHRPLPRK